MTIGNDISVLAAMVIVGVLTACQPKNTDNYTLSGTATGMADGDTLFLVTDLENGNPSETLLVHQGRFHLEGHVDNPTLCFLVNSDQRGVLGPFFLEPGTINIDYEQQSGESHVSGTNMNEALQALNDSVIHYGSRMNDILATLYSSSPTQEEQQAATAQIAMLTNSMNGCMYRTAEQNIGNELGYAILTYFDNDNFSREQLRSLISKMPEEMRSRQRIKELEASLDRPQGATTLPDLRINASRGGEVSILEEVSKNPFTIIDFWASWCAPCLRDMPKMVRLYHRYHSQGIGMIGISLDMDANEWQKAIDRTGQPWLQLCDMKGWESDIAEQLHIQAIPHTLLVDSTGKVLVSGLSCDDLEAFLEELMF